MSIDLADYVDVATRTVRFYERNPDGRIQASPPEVVTIGDSTYLAVTARVWRTPDDPTPCVASAWEPWPGRTPYTRDSEAMNAETSAIGRALAAAGVEVRRSLASADEVRVRQPNTETAKPVTPTRAQLRELMALYTELGVTNRADQKQLGSALLGIDPPLTTHNDLTPAQMNDLMAALKQQQAAS